MTLLRTAAAVAASVAALLMTLASPTPARAAFATSCDGCESCTRVLSAPDAKVEVTEDILHQGDGPCIVIRGAGAQLDGLERDLRTMGGAGTVGVSVEADGVLVKNLHIYGADVGIRIDGATRATLFHHVIEATVHGVEARATTDLRVSRSLVRGGRVGVAFGASDDGSCAGSLPLSNRAAVITGTHVEGATTGIAACDAIPVVRGSTLARNGTGIVLGSPVAAPGEAPGAASAWDSCVCAPDLDRVSGGTALFFSSGCHGCQVHEAWLPELRAAGHDVVVRASGLENAEASRVFDAFMDRCAPQVTDVIGVPGCVPNYVCLATDLTFKVRDGENGIHHETQVGTKDALIAYERACRLAAERSYAGPSCVSNTLIDNVICDNAAVDVRGAGGAAVRGAGNACGRTEGWSEGGADGCDAPCPGSIETPGVPGPRVREGAGVPSGMLSAPQPPSPPGSPPMAATAVVPPAPAPVVAGPTPAPVAAVAPPATPVVAPMVATAPVTDVAVLAPVDAAASSRPSPRFWLVLGGAVLALLLLVGLVWLRWEDRP